MSTIGSVPARSSALANDIWHDMTGRVIDDMLQSGEDVSDTGLYKHRLAEAVAALRGKLAEAGQ